MKTLVSFNENGVTFELKEYSSGKITANISTVESAYTDGVAVIDNEYIYLEIHLKHKYKITGIRTGISISINKNVSKYMGILHYRKTGYWDMTLKAPCFSRKSHTTIFSDTKKNNEFRTNTNLCVHNKYHRIDYTVNNVHKPFMGGRVSSK